MDSSQASTTLRHGTTPIQYTIKAQILNTQQNTLVTLSLTLSHPPPSLSLSFSPLSVSHSSSPYCFRKRTVLRLDLKETIEGFFRTGRGRSFPVDGKDTETDSGKSGTRGLKADSVGNTTESTGVRDLDLFASGFQSASVATARYYTSHTKTKLPTRKSVQRSSRQSDHTKTS